MTTTRPRVLVVDDQPANRMAFEIVLEKDFTVRLAESGQEALEAAEREDFAVILLDIRMPILDGYETAAELRRRVWTRHTPIIFTSAVDRTPEHVVRAFSAGVTDFLFSPVDGDVLRLKVQTYAQIHLRNRALRTQIDDLSGVVRSLRAELAKSTLHDAVVEIQVRRLEVMSEELKGQLAECPA